MIVDKCWFRTAVISYHLLEARVPETQRDIVINKKTKQTNHAIREEEESHLVHTEYQFSILNLSPELEACWNDLTWKTDAFLFL